MSNIENIDAILSAHDAPQFRVLCTSIEPPVWVSDANSKEHTQSVFKDLSNTNPGSRFVVCELVEADVVTKIELHDTYRVPNKKLVEDLADVCYNYGGSGSEKTHNSLCADIEAVLRGEE